MKYKVLIFIIFLLCSISSAYASLSSNPNDFSIDILSGQNTALSSLNTTFGFLMPGTTDNAISTSFTLTNSGNINAAVSATFTTFTSGIYGMTNTTYVIGGGNFSMNLTGQTPINLDNLATDTDFTASHNVISDAIPDVWNVQLDVPAGQSTAIYSGLIQLTFTSV